MFESPRERNREAENSLKNRGFRLFPFLVKIRTQNLTGLAANNLLIRAKFFQKILLIEKLYVPVSMKINQSKNCYEYMEQLHFYGHAYFFMIRLPHANKTGTSH